MHENPSLRDDLWYFHPSLRDYFTRKYPSLRDYYYLCIEN